MKLVIVTGMSGAGKRTVIKILEDAGYFCVDNLPIHLMPRMMKLIHDEDAGMDKVALAIDVRNGKALYDMENVLAELDEHNYKYEILYMDCSDEVLIKRFKETRRTHPLTGLGRVEKGIAIEREKLEFLKKRADYIIDTSHLLVRELKAEVDHIFLENGEFNNFFLTILSFGFKYGIPADSDLVMDVRFLENPFYIPELKHKTGQDRDVYDFVMSSEDAVTFLNKLEDLCTFLIPNYRKEGKNQLVISIGCTGGKHRSVTLARALGQRLQKLNYGMKVEHRDIKK